MGREADFLKQPFLNNPPLGNDGGLFVPVVGLRFKQKHMNHNTETPAQEAQDHRAHTRHGITLLSNIYLEAGLPLDLAIESAAADYALFEEDLLCA